MSHEHEQLLQSLN